MISKKLKQKLKNVHGKVTKVNDEIGLFHQLLKNPMKHVTNMLLI